MTFLNRKKFPQMQYLVSLVPRLFRSGTWMCTCRESPVSFLTWAWRDQNRTRVFWNRKATFCSMFNYVFNAWYV